MLVGHECIVFTETGKDWGGDELNAQCSYLSGGHVT